MSDIRVNVEIDDDLFEDILDSLLNDSVMLQVHNLFAKMCDPYVPMDEGVLAQSLEITPNYIRYNTPYAHYQYMGMVYGPSIPIIEDGIIVGWWSPPDKEKYPTGASISYNTSKHPLATKEWDKAMMRDKKDEFVEQVKQILIRRAKELYG